MDAHTSEAAKEKKVKEEKMYAKILPVEKKKMDSFL